MKTVKAMSFRCDIVFAVFLMKNKSSYDKIIVVVVNG
jgi:hypothetical protein